MKPNFNNQFTALQTQVINRLAEIEKEDADACASCGGEDCVCCEIYLDRQKWVSADELFAEDDFFGRNEPDYDFFCDKCGKGFNDEWCDECGETVCLECCTCEG